MSPRRSPLSRRRRARFGSEDARKSGFESEDCNASAKAGDEEGEGRHHEFFWEEVTGT